jgi:hypothetical protein
MMTFSSLYQTQKLKNKKNKFLDQNWIFKNYKDGEG